MQKWMLFLFPPTFLRFGCLWRLVEIVQRSRNGMQFCTIAALVLPWLEFGSTISDVFTRFSRVVGGFGDAKTDPETEMDLENIPPRSKFGVD